MIKGVEPRAEVEPLPHLSRRSSPPSSNPKPLQGGAGKEEEREVMKERSVIGKSVSQAGQSKGAEPLAGVELLPPPHTHTHLSRQSLLKNAVE